MEPTAKLNGEASPMAIELNKGAGVVDVVVVGIEVVLDVDVETVEQAPVNTVRATNNPTIKQYPKNPDFFLFTLFLRFLYPTNQ